MNNVRVQADHANRRGCTFVWRWSAEQRWLRCGSCFLVVCFAMSCGVWGADSLEGPPGSQRFRRLFVPEEHVDELAKGFLPMRRNEYQRLLNGLNQARGESAALARIASGQYTARWNNDGTLSGEAVLEIVHTAEQVIALPLVACQLAIGQPQWRDKDAVRDAVLAVSPDGAVVIIVDRSSVLHFPWTLRGESIHEGETEFQLALPASPLSTVELTMPSDLVPQSERGILQKLDSGTDDAPNENRRWRLDLGASFRTGLRVSTLDERIAPKSDVMLRSELTYGLSPNSARFSAYLHLDVYDTPIQQLTIDVDPQLQLLAAQIGENPIEWRRSAGDRKSTQITLDFPEPLLGLDRVVRLEGMAPITIGRPSDLPRVRPVDVHWQEGKATILVPFPLSLQDVITSNCSVREFTPLPSPGGGETLQVQDDTPDASMQVLVNHLSTRTRVTCATSIHLDETGMTADLAAELTTTQGEQYQLEMNFSPNWVIESVEASEPAPDPFDDDLLLDWNVSAEGTDKHLLRIQLRRALRAGRSVRLVVRANRSVPREGEEMGIQEFQLGQFRDVTDTRHLVSVDTRPPLRIRHSGDAALTTLAPETLTGLEQELLLSSRGAMIFLADAAAEALVGRVERTPSQFDCQISASAVMDRTQLLETYQIRCVPLESRVGRLLVHLSEKRLSDVDWRLEGETDSSTTVQRLTEEQRRNEQIDADAGEVWEIVLRRAREVPFTLTGSRSTAFEGRVSLAVAWLPNAGRQTGTFDIRSADGTSLIVEPGKELERISAPPQDLSTYGRPRALYRYNPGEPVNVVAERADKPHQLANLWAWSCHMRSRFGQQSALHEATYFLENVGRRLLTIQMAEQTRLRDIKIDEQSVALSANHLADDVFVIALPERVRFPRLQLTYTDLQPLPRLFGKRSLRPPDVDFPVLDRRASFWLPPGVSVAGHRDAMAGLPRSSWQRRLFGALGPWSSARSTDQALSAYWNQFLEAGRGPRIPGPDAAFRFGDQLRHVVEQFTSENPNMALTWGLMLERFQELEAANRQLQIPPVLIEWRSVRAAGITADREVDVQRIIATDLHLEELLHAENLAIVIEPDVLLLTGASELRREDASLVPTSSRHIAIRVPDDTAPLTPRTFERQSIDQWNARTIAEDSPWSQRIESPVVSKDDAQWTMHSVVGMEPQGATVELLRTSRYRAIASVAVLLMASLSWWICASRPVRVIPLAGLTGVVALLAPEPTVPVFSGVFLGVLVACGLVMLGVATRHRPVGENAHDRSDSRVPISTASIWLLAVLAAGILLGTSMLAVAQEIPASDPASTVHKVVIPIDEQRAPVGDLVFVSPGFYELLVKTDTSISSVEQPWLLRAVTYEGNLSWESVGTQLGLSDFKATFELNVYSDQSPVVLPFRQGEIHLLADAAELDGQSIPISWHVDGNGLELEPLSIGPHRLVIHFQPTVAVLEGWTGFNFATARIPRSQLRLQVPDDAAGVQIDSRIGRVRIDEGASQLVAELGPSDRVVARWPHQQGAQSSPAEVTVDELQWLRVNPGSVALDARFRFNVPDGQQLDRISLHCDPRLDVRFPPGQPIGEVTRQVDGSRQRVDVELTQPRDGPIELTATLVVPGASGIGQLRLPRISAEADHVRQRLLAVTIGRQLDYEMDDIRGAVPVSLDRLVRDWGDSVPDELTPNLLYQLNEGPVEWEIKTRPKSAVTAARQQQQLSVGLSSVETTYRCQLETSGGFHILHRFTVPNRLQIDDVLVVDDGVERAVRWSRSTRSTVVVFFDDRRSGEYEVLLRGTLPVPRNRRPALPRIDCRTATVNSTLYELYRRSDVIVDVEPLTGWEEIQDNPPLLVEPLGRFVSRYVVTSESSVSTADQARLRIRPNQPDVDCVQVTQVHREGQDWIATVFCYLTVENGIVDTIRLDMPAQLTGPYAIQPPARLQVNDLLPTGRRHLIISPTTPITGTYELRVSGRLTSQPLEAPDVGVLEVQNLTRYLVLATRIGSQQVEWDVSGATIARPPSRYQLPETPNFEVYRSVFRTYQAVIKDIQPEGVPRVALADVRLVWLADDTCSGVVSFDVQPAGQDRCHVRLPAQINIIHATVAGLPALMRRMNRDEWELQLGPTQLPQRVTILFHGELRDDSPAKDGLFELPIPELVDIRPLRTLWTIYSPSDRRLELADRGQHADSLMHHRYRYAAATELGASANDFLDQQPTENARHWLLRWARQLQSARNRLVRSLAGRGPERKLEPIPDRLMSQIDLMQGGTGRTTPLAAWQSSSRDYQLTLAVTDQETSPVSLRVVCEPLPAGLWKRAGYGLVLATICSLLGVLIVRGPGADWLVRWPGVAGVTLGLIWWLWLTPAIIGMIILVASVVASLQAIRQPVRRS